MISEDGLAMLEMLGEGGSRIIGVEDRGSEARGSEVGGSEVEGGEVGISEVNGGGSRSFWLLSLSLIVKGK